METGFLSFFVVKLKQIHIDKGITTGYSTNILQCAEYIIIIIINLDHVQRAKRDQRVPTDAPIP